MKIYKNSWYIRSYKFLRMIKYDHNLPQDICSLRNQLLLTTVIFILTAPTWLTLNLMFRISNLLPGNKNDDAEMSPAMSGLLSVFGFIMGMLLIVETPYINYPWAIVANWFIGPMIFIGGIFFVIIAAFLLYHYLSILWPLITQSVETKESDSSKEPGVIKKLYISWRDRYCEKIEWK